MNVKRRVRIERDEMPMRPDDDGQMPVIWVPYIGHDVGILAGAEYLPHVSALVAARRHLGWEQMERWLNLFVGKVTVRHEHIVRNGMYVEVASDEWMEAMSTPDWKPDLTDYKGGDMLAYLEGEVYRLIPEVLTKWTAEDGRERIEWEEDPEMFAVHGYYGQEHALDSAKHEFYDEHFVVVDEDGTILFEKEEK